MRSSFTARSAHGSQPWRVTNLSSGKNQHTSSIRPTYCGANRHPRPGHARAHVDRDVELDALGVDREELLVVDRHLRVEPAREGAGRLHAELLDRARQIAHRRPCRGSDPPARSRRSGRDARGARAESPRPRGDSSLLATPIMARSMPYLSISSSSACTGVATSARPSARS